MNEQHDELTLRGYSQAIRRHRWIVVAITLLFAGGGFILSTLQDSVYEASARMGLRAFPGGTVIGAADNPVIRMGTEVEVMKGERVRRQVAESLGLRGGPARATARAVGASGAIDVIVRTDSPEAAQALADAYVQAYIDLRKADEVAGLTSAINEVQATVDSLGAQIDNLDETVDAADPENQAALEAELAAQRSELVTQRAGFNQNISELQIRAALATGGAELIEPATLPEAPVEPTPMRTTLLALIAGLVFGVIAAFLIDFFDSSARTSSELETAADGSPVLAVVPADPPPDRRPVSQSRPNDFAAESYRTLRTNLQFLGVDQPMRVIQISSSMPGEGKSTTAANLAVVLAQAGGNVLLIDADLRRPTLHRHFGVNGASGLTDALLGAPLETLVIEIQIGDGVLGVLPAGRVPPNPSELLGGSQMRALLESIPKAIDVIVLDSAPVLPVTDAVILSRMVDGLVLVTDAGVSTRNQVSEAVRTLTRVSAPLVGVVMNRVVKGRLRSGDYGYGSGFDSRYGYAPPSELDSEIDDIDTVDSPA